MDSEHRHELEENVLAGWLADKVEEIKPQLPLLAVIAVVALVCGVGLSYLRSSNEASRAEAWRDFSLTLEGRSPNIDALRQTAFEVTDPDVSEWALITFADGQLWQASASYLQDRSRSDEALAEAETTYDSLIRASNEDISARATYGLARVYEMRGELDKAQEQYQRVSGSFADLAAERLEQLKSERVQKDYAWITGAEAPATETSAEDEPVTEEEAESTLDDILKGIDTGTPTAEEAPAGADDINAAAEDPGLEADDASESQE